VAYENSRYHSSIHIPATKPEKKKFTHANVSVCREKKLIKLTDLAFV